MPEDKWSRWLREERWGDEPGALQAALNSVRDRILDLAQLKGGHRVLDLGAGTGLLGLKAAPLVGPDGVVVLTDLSHDSLVNAREQGTTGSERFTVADAIHCPFADDSFERVIMRSVLIYIPDRLSAAREIARVLRRGGRFVAYEPINRHMEQIVDMTGFEDVRDAYSASMDANPLCNFDENDLVHAFHIANFASVEMELSESRFPVRGKDWAHGFRYGAPAGYNAYDRILAAGICRERVDELLAHGERLLGDEWRVWSCPCVYIVATR